MENVRGAAKRPAGAPSQKPTPSGGIRTAIRDHFRAISPADSSRRVARTPPSPRPAARLELPSARWTTKAPHPFALRHGALDHQSTGRWSTLEATLTSSRTNFPLTSCFDGHDQFAGMTRSSPSCARMESAKKGRTISTTHEGPEPLLSRRWRNRTGDRPTSAGQPARNRRRRGFPARSNLPERPLPGDPASSDLPKCLYQGVPGKIRPC